MTTTSKQLFDLVAADLMTRQPVVLPQSMPLRDAAELLVRNRMSGAPVVDASGRCVGVLSASDFLRLAANPEETAAQSPLPRTCGFQVNYRQPGGEVVTYCTLGPGACPMQMPQPGAESDSPHVCREPHTVLTDWQMVEVEELPVDEVRRYMTPDPVTAGAEVGIGKLAQMMIDAQVHRVIVVDEDRKPVGVVSSSDLLSALATANGKS